MPLPAGTKHANDVAAQIIFANFENDPVLSTGRPRGAKMSIPS
ncbi:MAG TPA: hypothetical protein VKM94_26725 [Blastocatellia bacterium]|nr:hypothetical protein [Blastocatellia bacterium]